MAHPGLRRKMDHTVEFLGGKQRFDAAAIGQVQLFEAEIPLPLQYLEPRCLEARIIVVVEIVESDDFIAACQQSLAHEEADEAGGAGDQYLHVPTVARRSDRRETSI